jgi:hypothetical protein
MDPLQAAWSKRDDKVRLIPPGSRSWILRPIAAFVATAGLHASAYLDAPRLPGSQCRLLFHRVEYVPREVTWVLSVPRIALFIATVIAFAMMMAALLKGRHQRRLVAGLLAANLGSVGAIALVGRSLPRDSLVVGWSQSHFNSLLLLSVLLTGSLGALASLHREVTRRSEPK